MLYFLFAALGAIVEFCDHAIFIRKVMQKGVAKLMGLTVGSSITSLWDIHNCDYRLVRIVKQPHSEHFHLNGMLAVHLSSSEQLDTNQDERVFRLENGELVRLSDHEFEETSGGNILKFAATEQNRVSYPLTHQNIMKMEGPHMILKILAIKGAKVSLSFS